MMPPPTIAASYRSIRRTIGSAAVDGIERRAQARPLAPLSRARGAAARPGSVGAPRRGAPRRRRHRPAARQGASPTTSSSAAAEPFRRACDAHGALFVLNDRPELVERCGADGVHVGQGDAPLAEARRAVGAERIVGLSATTRGGAPTATPTTSASARSTARRRSRSRRPAGSSSCAPRATRCACRGSRSAASTHDTIAEVAASGAAGVAVVRAIRDAADPEDAARELRAQLPPSDAVVTRTARTCAFRRSTGSSGRWAPAQKPVAPHTHAAHTDVFYVLDGTMEFRARRRDGARARRLVRRGAAAARARLPQPGRRRRARFLNLHAPGVLGARAGSTASRPSSYDTFGADRASAQARPIVSATGRRRPARRSSTGSRS